MYRHINLYFEVHMCTLTHIKPKYTFSKLMSALYSTCNCNIKVRALMDRSFFCLFETRDCVGSRDRAIERQRESAREREGEREIKREGTRDRKRVRVYKCVHAAREGA